MSREQQPAATLPLPAQLMQLIWPGAMVAQAIYTAAKLRIADHLHPNERAVEDLANAAGADPQALQRLLRTLAGLGVFEETTAGTFRNTQLSDTLRSDIPASMGAWALFLGAPFNWQLWGSLEEAVRTGAPATDRVYGKSFWQYLAENPGDAKVFNDAMNSGSQMAASAIVSTYDFSSFATIVDVGGGQGSLLHAILSATPGLKGILYDLPEVVAKAAILRTGEVADRAEIVGGNFLESVPPADGYIMKGVIHDWSDADALTILKNCRTAILPHGKLLIHTGLLQADQPRSGDFMDIYMMLYGGRERTEAELRTIINAADFAVRRVIPDSPRTSILECEPS